MSSGGDMCTGGVVEERIDCGRVGGEGDVQAEAEGRVLKVIRPEHLQGYRRAGAGISVPSGNSLSILYSIL